jgi:L-arabinose isomerase
MARALWRPRPSLAAAAEAWILAGGPHHTALSQQLGLEHIADLAAMTGLELVVIDDRTDTRELTQQLRWNEAYHRLFSA